jgi:hypothetical protein
MEYEVFDLSEEELEKLRKKAPILLSLYDLPANVFLLSKNKPHCSHKSLSFGMVHFLVEIPNGRWQNFKEACIYERIDAISGQPLDPSDHHWHTNSPQAIRLRYVFETLNVDAEPYEKIIKNLEQFTAELDILLLPFNWRERTELIEKLNTNNPEIQTQINRTAPLLHSQKSE